MRIGLTVAALAVMATWSCGPKPEWVTPKSGEPACMCSAVCQCQGMTPTDESEAERKRCWDACDCATCPAAAK